MAAANTTGGSQQPAKVLPALKPASWRGVPFAVVNSSAGGGRLVVVHKYPGKEEVWTEDIANGPGEYHFRGFILDGSIKLGGTTIVTQRAKLIAAFEQKGSGTLVHPTLGNLTVNLRRWTMSEALDASGYSELDLEFVDAGKQVFPTAQQSNGVAFPAGTSDPVQIAAAARAANPVAASSRLKTALQSDAAYVIDRLASGQSISALALLGMGTGLLGLAGVRADLVTSIAIWAAKAIILAKDATSLLRLTAVLPGNYGRFGQGGNAGLTASNASAYSASTKVADLISVASTQRVAVSSAAANLNAVAAATDLTNPIDLQPAASALMDAVIACCADPADAIRLLLQLIGATIGGNQTQTTYVVSQLVMRAAAAALCEASAAYQPASADDAALRIAQICPALDALSLQASAMGDDASYTTLAACRSAVAADLRARGATLAQVRTFDLPAPVPALALAQRLYRDATRADQLVAQAQPANPLFFPPQFQALAS